MATSKERPGVAQIIVRMPSELYEAIKERAAKEERSTSQAVRYAIRQYLRSEEGA